MAETSSADDEACRKIFVGGLSWETTEDELLVYFEKYGDVVDVVIMTDTATKRSRGFGFVTFKNAASADAACDHIDHVIDSRKIDVKLGEVSKNYDQLAVAVKTCKIVVLGLPDESSEEDIRVHFSQFGRVTEIDLKRDKETNRMTGYGFVTFEDEAEADNACKNYYQTLLGKKVEVKLAEPRNRSPGEVHRQQQFIYSDHHLISTGYGGSQDSGRGSGYPQQYPYSSGGGYGGYGGEPYSGDSASRGSGYPQYPYSSGGGYGGQPYSGDSASRGSGYPQHPYSSGGGYGGQPYSGDSASRGSGYPQHPYSSGGGYGGQPYIGDSASRGSGYPQHPYSSGGGYGGQPYSGGPYSYGRGPY